MSDEEQSSLLKEFKVVKRWYPVIAGIIIVALFLIECTHYFDSNIATTKDIERVEKKIEGLHTDLIGIKISMDNHDVRDTTDKININNRLTNVEIALQKIIDHRIVGIIGHKNCPTCKTTFSPQ